MEILSTTNCNIYKVEGSDTSFKTLYLENKVWLNTHEISSLYNIDEHLASKFVKEIFFDRDLDITLNIKRQYNKYLDDYDNYYSMDVIILLWYMLKLYDKAKLVIKTNNELKKYVSKYNSSRESRISKLNRDISIISKAIKFIDKNITSAI